jgi:hypothetical protein
MKSKILVENYSYEELAHALYAKGEKDGYKKVTDKTKWREPVMAEKLGHDAHKAISAGKNSNKYGSDAFDSKKGMMAEYKTKALSEKDNEIKKLLGKPGKNGRPLTPLKAVGIYNGAYTQEAIDKYAKIDHYFGLFHKEKCVLIIKPNTSEVIKQLQAGYNKKKLSGGTTNLNTVSICLGDQSLYSVEYKNDEFFKK